MNRFERRNGERVSYDVYGRTDSFGLFNGVIKHGSGIFVHHLGRGDADEFARSNEYGFRAVPCGYGSSFHSVVRASCDAFEQTLRTGILSNGGGEPLRTFGGHPYKGLHTLFGDGLLRGFVQFGIFHT